MTEDRRVGDRRRGLSAWARAAAGVLVLLLVYLAGVSVAQSKTNARVLRAQQRLAAERFAAAQDERDRLADEIVRLRRDNAQRQALLERYIGAQQSLALRLLSASTAPQRRAAVEGFRRDTGSSPQQALPTSAPQQADPTPQPTPQRTPRPQPTASRSPRPSASPSRSVAPSPTCVHLPLLPGVCVPD